MLVVPSGIFGVAGKLKNTEIGEILDMKEKTVSVVLLRAVRRLRQEIEKEAAK